MMSEPAPYLFVSGPGNSLTDVSGIQVGHSTVIEGDGPLVVGSGPFRTGVTMVIPRGFDRWTSPVFAGWHRLNGNGEFTGLHWIAEAGQLGGPIALTNTYSLGVVRDALIRIASSDGMHDSGPWSLPVVAETWDGVLNDIEGQHLNHTHVVAALRDASSSPVEQGNVGGGTGMISFGFKAGIGSASRLVSINGHTWTLGVLVQSNFGDRHQLTVRGEPLGLLVNESAVPLPAVQTIGGSIIVIIATDAPLLPQSCQRIAQRASLGIARVGGTANNSSGDFALCFSTANDHIPPSTAASCEATWSMKFLSDGDLTPLFKAAVEATEAAILHALLYAETLTGRDDIVAHVLPRTTLEELLI